MKNIIPFNAASDQTKIFVITGIDHYVPVVTLSTKDKVKLLEHLKSLLKNN